MKNLVYLSIFLAVSVIPETGRGDEFISDRGEIGTYGNKFIWTGTGEAFVPNYIMLDVLQRYITPRQSEIKPEQDLVLQAGNYNDLRCINQENLDMFIDEFIYGHGFNGIHVPVFGQWFHIGDNLVTENDSIPDSRTFDKLEMIIEKVYEAGGSTYIWVWGDHERGWTSKSTRDGIMGIQEQAVMDMIAQRLGPVKGWFMGYGFDLWEWVSEDELRLWHEYMWSKPGWNKLLGARASKNELNQIYEGLDFSDYEYHKPWYEELSAMINVRPHKPSFSGDRYRIRRDPPGRWPEKDYDEDETRRGLWQHTMAGGIGAIWGNLDRSGTYANKDELKCFSLFWNDNKRFRKNMVVDNSLTDGYCLRDSDKFYIFYKENTVNIKYVFSGDPKKVIVVDTKSSYRERDLGVMEPGYYIFEAPYKSDWVISVELTED
jgi:hypothetical protein